MRVDYAGSVPKPNANFYASFSNRRSIEIDIHVHCTSSPKRSKLSRRKEPLSSSICIQSHTWQLQYHPKKYEAVVDEQLKLSSNYNGRSYGQHYLDGRRGYEIRAQWKEKRRFDFRSGIFQLLASAFASRFRSQLHRNSPHPPPPQGAGRSSPPQGIYRRLLFKYLSHFKSANCELCVYIGIRCFIRFLKTSPLKHCLREYMRIMNLFR